MKKNDIVKDDSGNYFRVLDIEDSKVEAESVATQELFTIPIGELIVVDA